MVGGFGAVVVAVFVVVVVRRHGLEEATRCSLGVVADERRAFDRSLARGGPVQREEEHGEARDLIKRDARQTNGK